MDPPELRAAYEELRLVLEKIHNLETGNGGYLGQIVEPSGGFGAPARSIGELLRGLEHRHRALRGEHRALKRLAEAAGIEVDSADAPKRKKSKKENTEGGEEAGEEKRRKKKKKRKSTRSDEAATEAGEKTVEAGEAEEETEEIPAPAEEKEDGAAETRTVFIGGLPFSATEETVKKDFEKCGEIVHFSMPMNWEGKPKGIAFVEFTTVEAVTKALEYNETDYGGRTIYVRKEEAKGGKKGQKGAGKKRDFPTEPGGKCTVFLGIFSGVIFP